MAGWEFRDLGDDYLCYFVTLFSIGRYCERRSAFSHVTTSRVYRTVPNVRPRRVAFSKRGGGALLGYSRNRKFQSLKRYNNPNTRENSREIYILF